MKKVTNLTRKAQ